MAMGSDDVATLVEQAFQGVIEMQCHVVNPRETCVHHLRSVDVEFKHIIVGILQIKVLLQLVGSKLHIATDIDVSWLTRPTGLTYR